MSDIGEHDRIILNSIFNPFLPIGESNYDGDLAEELIDNEEITASVLRAKEIELEGVKAADAGDLLRAERLFTEALSVADRASGYNNRAQVLRLQGRDGAAFLDLNKAVEVSGGRGKAGCQAYCQRALLHRRNGRDSEAKDDFTMAAQLGSSFAKQQLVEMNPYAAMCNQMLNDMMAKLHKIDCTSSIPLVRTELPFVSTKMTADGYGEKAWLTNECKPTGMETFWMHPAIVRGVLWLVVVMLTVCSLHYKTTYENLVINRSHRAPDSSANGTRGRETKLQNQYICISVPRDPGRTLRRRQRTIEPPNTPSSSNVPEVW